MNPNQKTTFGFGSYSMAMARGLTESDITFSTGASLVSMTGSKSVWEATIRPPETAAVITMTIAANAFTEGNAETSLDIRVSTSFPDTDAEDPTQLFTLTFPGRTVSRAMTITPTRILIAHTVDVFQGTDTTTIRKFTHAGVQQMGETLSRAQSSSANFNYINGDLLFGNTRYRESGDTFIEIGSVGNLTGQGKTSQTGLGFVRGGASELNILPYGETTPTTISTPHSLGEITHSDNLLYSSINSNALRLSEIEDSQNTLRYFGLLNIEETVGNPEVPLAIYTDTLYIFKSPTVYTLDIRKYRPLTKNTKTTIYPVFANEGDTIPLTQFCPDAHTITFGTGFDKPTYLSINADNELEIASNAVTETQPVLVRLTGINYIDSVDFQFYLIIVQAANPTVRDITDLAMYASTTFNLFDVVDNATAITFRSGQTQPTGSSISNGIFTIGTAGGTAYFTATNANGSTNFEIAIDVVSVDPITSRTHSGIAPRLQGLMCPGM